MITISSAESALKNVFLDSAISEINQKTNPFLNMIAKNAKTSAGKEARAAIRFGNKGSVVVGSEGGELPVNNGGRVAEIATDLKNIYGTFQISDKAIRSAQNNPNEFANLLAKEMKNLVDIAKYNLNAMLYGNGLKLLGHTTECSLTAKTMKVDVKSAANFPVDKQFKMFNSNNAEISNGNLTVASIASNGTITFTGAITDTTLKDDRFYLFDTVNNGEILNGVDSIFRQDKLYNLNRSEYGEILPYIHVGGVSAMTGQKALTETEVMDFLTSYENYCESMPADVLLTNPTVRRTIHQELGERRTNIDVGEFAAGFVGFTFNGIPVYSDVKCKGGTMYALRSEDWAMHQLCDWTWLSGEEGDVLKQIEGRAGYSATLVKYADLLCDKPFLQGKACNFSAVKFS
jgi:hypothetical protein